MVFDDVQARSPLLLVSIAEAARDVVRATGFHRVGLFGTRFTMQGRFYPDVFSAADIDVVVPRADEQSYIHDKYVNKLLKGHFLPTTRDGLLSILEDMRARDRVDAILLAGTELPLLLPVGTAAQCSAAGYNGYSRQSRCGSGMGLGRRCLTLEADVLGS